MKKLIVGIILLMCFFSWSYTSGLNKICIYECASGDKVITIKGWDLCPETIEE